MNCCCEVHHQIPVTGIVIKKADFVSCEGNLELAVSYEVAIRV